MSRPRSRRPISITRYVRLGLILSRETDTRIRAIEPNVPMDSHDASNRPVNEKLERRTWTLAVSRSQAVQAEINRLQPSRASNTELNPRGETSVRGLDEYSVMVRVARQRYSRTAVWRFVMAGIVPQRSWRVRVHRDGCERCAGTRSVPIPNRGLAFDAHTTPRHPDTADCGSTTPGDLPSVRGWSGLYRAYKSLSSRLISNSECPSGWSGPSIHELRDGNVCVTVSQSCVRRLPSVRRREKW